MKGKKIISILILITLLIAQISFVHGIPAVYATVRGENESKVEVQMENNHYRYYYAQLSDNAKAIYDAMYEMYRAGDLKTGDSNYDLVEKGKISEDLVKAYQRGNNELIIAVETARDAFYLDYPEVFYINMEKFTIRITTDSNKKYHVWLGTGNNSSYYLHGFTSVEEVETAETAYNARVSEIVTGAKAVTADENENLVQKQIEYVHEQVVRGTTYKLDDVCKPENAGNIRTPYGALIAGESVCEGYSKAMKVILDKLDIPCILIRGIYRHGEKDIEAHMWNYAQVDGKWYAIDSTFDDDDVEENQPVTKEYLLVGENVMGRKHATDGIMSAPEFEFIYPELEYEDLDTSIAYDNNGLSIKYETTTISGIEMGHFRISYKGMGFSKAKENGYYFISKGWQIDTVTDEIQTMNWAYLLDDFYISLIQDDEDEEFSMYIPHMTHVEFGVTDVAPGPYDIDPYYLYYRGDSSLLLATSGILDNPGGTFLPAPRFVSASPYIETKLKPGKTTHIRVTYNEPLVRVEGTEPSGYVSSNAWTSSAVENSKLENFKFVEETNSVEFDFTPSAMWGDNSTVFYINVTGLVGWKSGKAPTPSYYYIQESFGCTYSMKAAGVWRSYARPTLIESGDLSVEDWVTSDGSKVSSLLTNRLALVTTETTPEQKTELNNLIEAEGDKVLKSETYNINLVMCKQNIVQTGHKITVYLGFPEGYGPDSAGVTFKAYHFKEEHTIDEEKNEYVTTTVAEPIDCVVTPYGLLVTCNSFSPFALVATEADNAEVDTSKTVAITTGENGTITNLESSLVTLNTGDTKTYTIKANNGYQIDSLTVCGTEITEAVGQETYTMPVKYDDIIDGNNIVNTTFVAKTVAQEETKRGETVVTSTVEPAEITYMPDEVYTNMGGTVTIRPNIISSTGIDTYQWYKDGEKLVGCTNLSLTINSVKESDVGDYTLEITSTANTVSEKVTSTPCKLVISDLIMTLRTDKENVSQGEEFTVTAKINNFSNSGEGIVIIAGKLEYDTSILEIVPENEQSLIGQNGWNLEAYNEENFKFIADNKYINESSDIFSIKFKVKDTIEEDHELQIKVVDVSASGGNGIININNAVQDINMKYKPESITSNKYTIENGIISRIAPNTTVADFMKNVTTEQSVIFTSVDGSTLTDTDVVTTGTTIKVGNTLNYILSVIGDIDQDGIIEVGDLAQLKLHLIDIETIDGIAVISADVDGDGEITINDLAQIKLVIITLLEIK